MHAPLRVGRFYNVRLIRPSGDDRWMNYVCSLRALLRVSSW